MHSLLAALPTPTRSTWLQRAEAERGRTIIIREKGGDGDDNTTAIVAAVLGTLVAVALIVGAILLLVFRKRLCGGKQGDAMPVRPLSCVVQLCWLWLCCLLLPSRLLLTHRRLFDGQRHDGALVRTFFACCGQRCVQQPQHFSIARFPLASC